jgi:hypothetical protein
VAIFFQDFAIFAQNTKNMLWNNPFLKWYLCEIKKILLVLNVSNSFKICYTWVVVVMSLNRAQPCNESFLSLATCYKNLARCSHDRTL